MTEYAQRTLDEGEALVYEVEGGTLEINTSHRTSQASG
jgi:hypothetical protein